MFATLFFNVFTVFLMMLPGFILIKKKIIPESVLRDLSQIIIKVFYPALIFSSITRKYTIQGILESWQLPFAVFIFCLIGYFVGLAYTGFFKAQDVSRKKSILLQFTINNYSFLPLAIIAKIYDEQHMAALILSTLGAELTVWTLGLAILNSQGGFNWKNLKNMLSPPLLSIYIAIIILLAFNEFGGITVAQLSEKNLLFKYVYDTVYQLGQAAIPVSLFMVGGRMGKIKFKDLHSLDIWGVTLFRLVIVPLIGVLFFKYFFGDHPFLNVMLIVAVMPSAMTSLVLGELYNADKKLISGTILTSHLLSLITIPLWLMFLL